MHCKGLCQMACGPVLMSRAEEVRIIERHGSLPEPGPLNFACSKLVDGRCSIYADRPLVCRLFGMVRRMQCPFGCAPEGGFLRERKARKLIARMEKVVP